MNERVPNPDFKSLAEFRLELRKFLSISADAAKNAGIDPNQHQLLLVIKGTEPEPVHIGDLADWLMIRHNSAVELVSRSERNGWVERSRSEMDRRQVVVSLTQKGENILNELSQVHMRELQSAGPRLIRTLTHILDQESTPS